MRWRAREAMEAISTASAFDVQHAPFSCDVKIDKPSPRGLIAIYDGRTGTPMATVLNLEARFTTRATHERNSWGR